MMVLKLYMVEVSPTVRSVLITAAALEIELERNHVQVFNKEGLPVDLKVFLFTFHAYDIYIISDTIS